MVLYAGIDLHSNNNVIVVQGEEDNVVARRRLPNDLAAVCEWLEPYRKDLAGVVVESTYNWYWMVDGLQERGYTVHLANTVAIQQYDGLKYRDDTFDFPTHVTPTRRCAAGEPVSPLRCRPLPRVPLRRHQAVHRRRRHNRRIDDASRSRIRESPSRAACC